MYKCRRSFQKLRTEIKEQIDIHLDGVEYDVEVPWTTDSYMNQDEGIYLIADYTVLKTEVAVVGVSIRNSGDVLWDAVYPDEVIHSGKTLQSLLHELSTLTKSPVQFRR